MNETNLAPVAQSELGRRLSSARRNKGMSQEEVAARLEVSRPTLVAIEKGTRAVKPDELVLLAQLYGRSVHSLVSGREFVSDFAPVFRVANAGEVTAEEIHKAVQTFRQACEDYLSLEELLGARTTRHRYPDAYEPGRHSVLAEAEEIALLERSRLHLGAGPLSDPVQTIEDDAGLRVFVLPLDEFRIAGMFAYADRLGGAILVNGLHPRARQNWSLAHEYGHFLLDRYREDITILVEYERKPRAEQFADAFAACFLMPAADLRRRFRRVVTSRNDFRVADLYLLADQYGVSAEAMARRLEDLSCIASGTWDRLAAHGPSATKLRSHLGLETEAASRTRLPDRYVRLAVQAFEAEEITEGELARLLHCPRVEARATVLRLTRPVSLGDSGDQYQLELPYGEALALAAGERAQ